MLNFLSQYIAHNFEASQHLRYTTAQVCSIASCGPGCFFSVVLEVIIIEILHINEKNYIFLTLFFIIFSNIYENNNIIESGFSPTSGQINPTFGSCDWLNRDIEKPCR